MGVLDDAIRQHLDLKRAHGAAEDEVRQQEHEALGPARREAEPEAEAAEPEAEAAEPEAEAAAPDTEAAEPAPVEEAPLEQLPESPFEPVDEREPYVPTGDTPTRGSPAIDEEEPAPEAPPAEEPPGDAEDVLEETPEFLQETPEHDKLWFEQKPPRDFDFDE